MIDLKSYRKSKKLKVEDLGLDHRTVFAIENGGRDVKLSSYIQYLGKLGLKLVIGETIDPHWYK